MKVFAHRGYSGKYPENTMLAFQKAAETGCYGIELDVQLTADGEVVVFHDETLNRVTDGTGPLVAHTLKEISSLNAANLWRTRLPACPIPTFEEYCRWASAKKLVTNVEIKNGVYCYEDLEEKVVAIIRKYGLENRILFSSFNHLSLSTLKELAPEIPRGALTGGHDYGNVGYFCRRHDLQCYHPDFQWLSEETVKNCKKHGIDVNVWTVNDKNAIEQMIEWDVDGIITNYPERCMEMLKANGK